MVRRREARAGAGAADDSRRRADQRAEEDDHRSRAAAAAVPCVDHAAPLRAWRCGARHRRRRARRREELAPLQAPRLRHADRAGRQRLSGLAAARFDVSGSRDAPARSYGGGTAEGDRRRDPEAAARAADSARARTVDQPDRSVVLQPDGTRRRLRRQGRSAQRVLHLHRQSGLVQRGPRSLPRAVGRRRERRRRAVPAARQARGADGRTGEETVTRTPLEVRSRHEGTKALSKDVWFRLFVSSWLIACAGMLSAQQAPDRTHPPQPGPPAALRLPAIHKQKLTNGLAVWIVEDHKVPVAQVNLVVFSGTANDPPGKYGVASFAAAMLEEGAGSRSALEIADAVDYLGADLSAASSTDLSAVRLHVPVARVADALPIMADVALRPTFPRDELERQRQQRLTSLLQGRDDPPTIAAVAFSRIVYGKAHRYGTPQMGTAETLKTFTPDDLRTFYASAFRPENATLLAIGDITADKALPLFEKNFGAWKTSETAANEKLPPTDEPPARQVYLIDKPGAAQSQIRIGRIGVPRSTADFFPLQVLNTILGGSFSSRLNNNLREKHGYTYGAGSSFDMRGEAGPFSASAGVQTDKTAEALKEFFNELNGILKPVPAEELARAKNYVSLRFPSTFETTGDISRRLEEAAVYKLPDDYFAKYVQNIEAVGAADVQRVAQKYIKPDHLTVMV